ncbi:MAG: hypothetical protein IT210_12400 [Armatimonadetes bacterium]|nr:hypothetical protein [Armatimonadota bacterium]
MKSLFQEPLSGIPLWAWQKFPSAFSEEKTDLQIDRALARMLHDIRQSDISISESAEAVKAMLYRILELLG